MRGEGGGGPAPGRDRDRDPPPPPGRTRRRPRPLGSLLRLVLDTSVLVSFLRAGLAEEDASFLRRRGPSLWLSSVVHAELLAGARNPRAVRAVRWLCEPLIRAGRVLTPSAADWETTGRVLARLRFDEGMDVRGAYRLSHDILISVSALRVGARIRTLNRADFERIRRYVPVELGEEPGPAVSG